MTKDELIAALEKAEGADDRLNLDIWKHCHPDRDVIGVWSANGMQFACNHSAYTRERFDAACKNASHFREPPQHKEYANHDELKPYTASIDAALTLVPNGSSLERLGQFMCLSKDGKALWQAEVRVSTLKDPYEKTQSKTVRSGFTPTAPIALCIAALRATPPAEKG